MVFYVVQWEEEESVSIVPGKDVLERHAKEGAIVNIITRGTKGQAQVYKASVLQIFSNKAQALDFEKSITRPSSVSEGDTGENLKRKRKPSKKILESKESDDEEEDSNNKSKKQKTNESKKRNKSEHSEEKPEQKKSKEKNEKTKEKSEDNCQVMKQTKNKKEKEEQSEEKTEEKREIKLQASVQKQRVHSILSKKRLDMDKLVTKEKDTATHNPPLPSINTTGSLMSPIIIPSISQPSDKTPPTSQPHNIRPLTPQPPIIKPSAPQLPNITQSHPASTISLSPTTYLPAGQSQTINIIPNHLNSTPQPSSHSTPSSNRSFVSSSSTSSHFPPALDISNSSDIHPPMNGFQNMLQDVIHTTDTHHLHTTYNGSGGEWQSFSCTITQEMERLKAEVENLKHEVEGLKAKLRGKKNKNSPPSSEQDETSQSNHLEGLIKNTSKPFEGMKTLLTALFTKEEICQSSLKGISGNMAMDKERLDLLYTTMEKRYADCPRTDIDKWIRGQQKKLRNQFKKQELKQENS